MVVAQLSSLRSFLLAHASPTYIYFGFISGTQEESACLVKTNNTPQSATQRNFSCLSTFRQSSVSPCGLAVKLVSTKFAKAGCPFPAKVPDISYLCYQPGEERVYRCSLAIDADFPGGCCALGYLSRAKVISR